VITNIFIRKQAPDFANEFLISIETQLC